MNTYINMDTKTCVFGYGAIDVCVTCQIILFSEIKLPVGAGTKIWNNDGTKLGDWEFTGNKIYVVCSTLDEVNNLANMLKEVEAGNISSFEYGGVTFDFTMYKQESMNVVKNAVTWVRLNILRVMAC